jgi:hypothetical protein
MFQLLNTASRKYLSVNAGQTSRTETTNLKVSYKLIVARVSLTLICRLSFPRQTLKAASLKFCPACYKVRSVGDEVRYNDQAKFESVRTEGQFLHCSSRCYRNKFPVLEHCMHGSFMELSL